MSDNPTPTDLRNVVLLGDHQTVDNLEMLEGVAALHGAAISAVFSFEPGEAAGCHELAEIRGLVTALSRAISARICIWVPYPREDLGRDEHFRRIGLVLQRHGLNLLAGTHLAPCPTTGGMSLVDFALRAEVQAVDNLDRAALAAGQIETLEQEIEAALIASADWLTAGLRPPARDATGGHETAAIPTGFRSEIAVRLPAALPSPDAPWPRREPALRRYVMWLTHSCKLTQSVAADCLNAMGQRTPLGYLWQQSTISTLLKGRYDRSRRRSVR